MEFQASVQGVSAPFLTFPESKMSQQPKSMPAASERRFHCPYPSCAKSFTRNKALQDHVQGATHENRKPFQCSLCSKAFTRSNDLSRHELEVHGERKFVCDEPLATGHRRGCGKRFSRMSTLKKHQQDCNAFRKPVMQPEDRITWPSVPEARIKQKARSQLPRDHAVWIHSESDFVCKICQARRQKSTPALFVRHLLEHLEDLETEAYHCPNCDASFVFQSHLLSHNLRLCEERWCLMLTDQLNVIWGCDKKFKDADEFKKHLRGENEEGSACRRRMNENKKIWKNILNEQIRIVSGQSDSEKWSTL